MKLEYFSNIKNGKYQKNIQEKMDAELILFEGKRIKTTREVVRNTRSEQQNRFYFGYFILSQQDCFYERWGERLSKDEVHEYNKSHIWFREVHDQKTGEIHKIPSTSTKFTTTEWEERMEMARQYFWKNFEWHLPLPHEQLEITDNNE